MSDDTNQEKLLHSFNEQFATNQNHGQTLFIQFLSAILVILTGYGYIYANTGIAADFWEATHEGKDLTSYSLMHLFGVLLVSELILTLLGTVVLNIGYAFRRDQLVICRLRKRVLGDDYPKLFGTQSFDPRGQNFWDFLPEFNRMFIYGIFLLQIFLLISFFTMLGRAICWTTPGSLGSLSVYILSIVPALWTAWLYNNYYKKYYKGMTNSDIYWWKVSLTDRLKKVDL
jgi:hypothetical protein